MATAYLVLLICANRSNIDNSGGAVQNSNPPQILIPRGRAGTVPITITASIDPPVNPQLADEDGHYGWNVVTGCWFVVASAPGYQSKISPLVGVPPEVTDLNIALQPLPNRLYLPVVVR